jgi:2-polyprenyl-3-methyl-5-hydroxy-6-metoxy-1,4-benzoquinol methylase
MSTSGEQVHGYYEKAYQGKTGLGARPPWDIGEPQQPFVELSRSGIVGGEVLDAGCGSGALALFLSGEGHSVTGVDISEQAIELARRQAAERGSSAKFDIGSVLDLSQYAGRFDTVVDCGMFHVLPASDQPTYVAALHMATKRGGRVCLLAMSGEARVVVKEKFAAAGVPAFLAVFRRV